MITITMKVLTNSSFKSDGICTEIIYSDWLMDNDV